VLAHGEVVEDEDVGFGVFADAFAPGAVGVAAGQIGEDVGDFREADVGSAAGDGVAEGLGDMAFADSDGSCGNSPNLSTAGCLDLQSLRFVSEDLSQYPVGFFGDRAWTGDRLQLGRWSVRTVSAQGLADGSGGFGNSG